MKICHVTSVHQPLDIRIFHKECCSLAKEGHEVFLVEKGESSEKNGVHIVGFGNLPASKIKRIKEASKKAYLTAKDLNCDVYHLHDPELLPYGLKLKKMGKKVIFDSHEDVPAQIMDKTWIPSIARGAVSSAYKHYETYAVKKFDAVVVATTHIADKFRKRAKKVVVINNYPKFDDIVFNDTPFSKRESIICYAGGISEVRGEKIMLEVMKNVDGKLIIAGEHKEMKCGHVQYCGKLDRSGVNELYAKSIAGLCILKPIENYYYSQPIKIYEYMAAGIPFICSDFPGWRVVAEESEAGICVNPDDTNAITDAITKLISDRSMAEEMGKNGRNYVVNHCSWTNEEKKLSTLYKEI